MLAAFRLSHSAVDQYLGLGGNAMGLHSSPSSPFGMLETKMALWRVQPTCHPGSAREE